jgi:hypothetical protein
MNIKSLSNLTYKDGFYDMFETTYISIDEGSLDIFEYVVDTSSKMRIDSICVDIYGDTTNVDFLLNFNNILMPLNIKEGDIIRYVDEQYIEAFKPTTTTSDDNSVKELLVNSNKQRSKDQNRISYNESGSVTGLPPTVADNAVEQVTVEGDEIVIGNGLFNT